MQGPLYVLHKVTYQDIYIAAFITRLYTFNMQLQQVREREGGGAKPVDREGKRVWRREKGREMWKKERRERETDS